MKKALLVTTVSGFVPQFEMNNVRLLQRLGYEVHYASNYDMPSYGDNNDRLNGTGIVRHQVDFVRSPYSWKNYQAYRQLKKVMKEGQYDLVHCHTPMGGALARIAAHRCRIKNVIYTAHGFHFYKGAPLKNWLIYYTMEYLLSYWTAQQICINKEDYETAKKHFHAGRVDYIPGVGLDVDKISNMKVDGNAVRDKLGIPAGMQVIVSAGELIKRKNHEMMIRAMEKFKDKNVVYLICGHGELEGYLKSLTHSLGLDDKVRFLGYREDIFDIYHIADVFVFPSYQEGLPFALLEAMACGRAVVCSRIRGNTDLIEEPEVMFEPEDIDTLVRIVSRILSDADWRKRLEEMNLNKCKDFDRMKVLKIMETIYRHFEQPKNM